MKCSSISIDSVSNVYIYLLPIFSFFVTNYTRNIQRRSQDFLCISLPGRDGDILAMEIFGAVVSMMQCFCGETCSRQSVSET